MSIKVKVENIINVLEINPISRLCAIIGSFLTFAIVAFTGYQISIDLRDREHQREIFIEERRERRESEKMRAWAYLLDSKMPPQLRGAAFTTLAASGEELNGVSFGCDDGEPNTSTSKCGVWQSVRGAKVENANVGWIYLDETVLHTAQITEAELFIYGDGSYLDESYIANSKIKYLGRDNGIINSNISDSLIVVEGQFGFSVAMSNVSGSCFSLHKSVEHKHSQYKPSVSIDRHEDAIKTREFPDVTFAKTWAFANNPPICNSGTEGGLRILEYITLCDPRSDIYLDNEIKELYDFVYSNRDLFLAYLAVFGLAERNNTDKEPLLGGYRGCKRMTLTEAMEEFPEAYN